MPSRISSISRAPLVNASLTGTVVAWKPDVSARYTAALALSRVKVWQIEPTALAACSWLTPGFSRPKTLRAPNARRFWAIWPSAAERKGHASTGM